MGNLFASICYVIAVVTYSWVRKWSRWTGGAGRLSCSSL